MDEDELLGCTDCEWYGPADDAMDTGVDDMREKYFCPECACLAVPLS